MVARGKVTDNEDGTARFETQCPLCPDPVALDRLDPAALRLYLTGRGPMVQDAFPRLSTAEHEVLMTGMHARCFELACGPEDEQVTRRPERRRTNRKR